MATVKKISRSVNYLPPIKTLTEWFNYAFKSSELDEVHRFPSLSGGGGGGPAGDQVRMLGLPYSGTVIIGYCDTLLIATVLK